MGCLCSAPRSELASLDDVKYQSVFQTDSRGKPDLDFLDMDELNATACELRCRCWDFIDSYGPEILHVICVKQPGWCVCIPQTPLGVNKQSRQDLGCTDDLQLFHVARFVYALYRQDWGYLSPATRAALYQDISKAIQDRKGINRPTKVQKRGFVGLQASIQFTHLNKVPNSKLLLIPQCGEISASPTKVYHDELNDEQRKKLFDALTTHTPPSVKPALSKDDSKQRSY